MKCSLCKKKAIINFTCKCEKVFCLHCRMPEDHSCCFDHIGFQKVRLIEMNPIVQGKKIDQI